MTVKEITREMKLESPYVAASSREKKDAILAAVREALLAAKEEIFDANRLDLEAAEKNNVPQQVQKRLKFNEAKLADVCAGIDQLISLEDPVGRTLLKRQMDEGLILERKSCPIGVIGVIFEARPDALVQISSLCIKSGNAVLLKGGREALRTNKVLCGLVRDALEGASLPADAAQLLETREDVARMLKEDTLIGITLSMNL